MSKPKYETKRCKRCGAIYLATDRVCPSCNGIRQDMHIQKRSRPNSIRQDTHPPKRNRPKSKLWIYPVLSFTLMVSSFITRQIELFSLGIFVILLLMIVILCRSIKKRFGSVPQADKAASTPVSARLLDIDRRTVTTASALHMAARGAVGAMLGGTPGFLIGMATTDQKTKTIECNVSFLVDYEDGHRGIETVDVRNARFLTLYELSEQRVE